MIRLANFLASLIAILGLMACGGGTDRFAVSHGGVITDSKTGLEWVVGPDEPTNYSQAEQWVGGCSIAGGGWLMPTCEELATLYQEDTSGNGSINAKFKLNINTIWIWSGESNAVRANVFNIHRGTAETFFQLGSHDIYCRVFAVRKGASSEHNLSTYRAGIGGNSPQEGSPIAILPEVYGVYAIAGGKITRLESGNEVVFVGSVVSFIWFDKRTSTFGTVGLQGSVDMIRLAYVSQEIEFIHEHSASPPVKLLRKPVGYWRHLEKKVELDAQPIAGHDEMIRFIARTALEPGGYALTIHGQTFAFATGSSMRFARKEIEQEKGVAHSYRSQQSEFQ